MQDQIMGAAALAAKREYGGIFSPFHTLIPIGLGAIKVIPANPNRISWLLVNVGTTQISVLPNPAVAVGTGVILPNNGSVFGSKYVDDADSVTAEWYGISNLAGGSLLLIESLQVTSDTEQRTHGG